MKKTGKTGIRRVDTTVMRKRLGMGVDEEARGEDRG